MIISQRPNRCSQTRRTATKKAALALDWTEHKWDDDWELWDLEVDHKYWKEMTEEEKAGAMHFGYTQHTWDGTVYH